MIYYTTNYFFTNTHFNLMQKRYCILAFALLFGMVPAYPSKSLANSVIWPLLTRWWLRPVNNDARVGEHIAVE